MQKVNLTILAVFAIFKRKRSILKNLDSHASIMIVCNSGFFFFVILSVWQNHYMCVFEF